jgi:uncharacterized protein (DUF1330 family)
MGVYHRLFLGGAGAAPSGVRSTVMSAGYYLVDIEWTDPDGRDRYFAKIGDVVAAYGGEFLTRGPEYESIEGDWHPDGRLVLIRFETADRGREWYRSEDYAPLLELRKASARTKVIFFEGA